MFWSPAVTTLSVVWAEAGSAANNDAASDTASILVFMRVSSGWECQQSIAWHDDVGVAALGHRGGVVHPDRAAGQAHAIAPAVAEIGSLFDYAFEAERGRVGAGGQARPVATEMRTPTHALGVGQVDRIVR